MLAEAQRLLKRGRVVNLETPGQHANARAGLLSERSQAQPRGQNGHRAVF